MEEWEVKVFIFCYSNHLFIGSVEIYFREVGAYVPLERATTGY